MPDSSSRELARRSGGSLAVGGPLGAPLRHPRLALTLVLWLLGLYLAFLARPAAITPQQELAFKAKIKEVREAGCGQWLWVMAVGVGQPANGCCTGALPCHPPPKH